MPKRIRLPDATSTIETSQKTQPLQFKHDASKVNWDNWIPSAKLAGLISHRTPLNEKERYEEYKISTEQFRKRKHSMKPSNLRYKNMTELEHKMVRDGAPLPKLKAVEIDYEQKIKENLKNHKLIGNHQTGYVPGREINKPVIVCRDGRLVEKKEINYKAKKEEKPKLKEITEPDTNKNPDEKRTFKGNRAITYYNEANEIITENEARHLQVKVARKQKEKEKEEELDLDEPGQSKGGFYQAIEDPGSLVKGKEPRLEYAEAIDQMHEDLQCPVDSLDDYLTPTG